MKKNMKIEGDKTMREITFTQREITITQAEYAALLEDSVIAQTLLALIANKVKTYGGIKYDELEMLCTLYGIKKENET